jgi:DNA mismatch repair protein MutS2
MKLNGTIVSDINGSGEFMVQMGIMKSYVHYTDLMLTAEEMEERKKEKSSGSGKIRMEKSASVSSSVNLIGQTVDEAMINLSKYLDDAYLAKLNQVTVIHGRGTGALRKAVQEKLRKTKYVKSFRAGMYGEGENGVTVVEFKR